MLLFYETGYHIDSGFSTLLWLFEKNFSSINNWLPYWLWVNSKRKLVDKSRNVTFYLIKF